MAAFKTLDDSIKPLAQRNHAMALRGIAGTTQKRMADLLNVSESTLSEWKDDHLERAMQVIAAAGLKVVPKEEKTLPLDEIAAYKVLARKAMDQETTSEWGSL